MMLTNVITKPTVKVLVAGGGLVATWLAVGSNHATAPPTAASTQQAIAAKEVSANDLDEQTARLRERISATQLRPSTRNPFRYGSKKISAAPSLVSVARPAETAPTLNVEPPPSYMLAGIAERNTAEGRRRTAVITGAGQLYVVTEGQTIGGRYTVARIDSEAVLLRDSSGAEITLILR